MTQQSASRRHVHIASDFDSTLTTANTLTQLASIAYNFSDDRTLPPYSQFVAAYNADLEAHVAWYNERRLAPAKRMTIEDEAWWLESLREMERVSQARVKQIFKGIDVFLIRRVAPQMISDEEVAFRPGCRELYQAIIAVDNRLPWLDVISINWSEGWVQACLEAYLVGSDLSSCNRLEANVYANHLHEGVDHRREACAAQVKDLRTSGDKAKQYALCRRAAKEYLVYKDATVISLYLGDSVTDLQCLLDADVGICIQDEPLRSGQIELMETCERLSIAVKPLSELDTQHVEHGSGTLKGSTIWSTRDLVEVRKIYVALQGLA